MNAIRSATSRAKPISWVTITMVMPLAASAEAMPQALRHRGSPEYASFHHDAFVCSQSVWTATSDGDHKNVPMLSFDNGYLVW
jgi:asparagine synthetase B (glutamine-hydrolysing)